MIDFFPAPSFYPKQDIAINAIDAAFEENDYKYVVAELPMGVGKSLIGYTAVCYYGNGYICTPQKSLQMQLVNERYKNVGFPMRKVEGRGNFLCNYSGKSCSSYCNKKNGIIDTCVYSLTSDDIRNTPDAISAKRGDLFWISGEHCPYLEQKVNAMNCPVVVPNYTYFIYETNYAGDLGQRELLVSDEAHGLEGSLYNFVETRITQEDMALLEMSDYHMGEEVSDWIPTLEDLSKDIIPKKLERLERAIENPMNRGELGILNYQKDTVTNLGNKISFILKKYDEEPENWIVEVNKEDKFVQSLVFKPINIGQWAEDIYFSKGKRNLLMSGTIVNFEKFMKGLGLESDEVKKLRMAPMFPPENQPTYNINIGKLNKDTLDIRNPNNKYHDVVLGVDLALTCFPDFKGIIHTTNYTMTNYIKENSKFADRILTHDSKNREEVMEYHMTTENPTVVCSPSFFEGADLKDDLSRFQVIPKVPYPYVGKDDKRMMKLMEQDPDIVDHMTKIRLIQTKARSIRSPTDYAVTITLDSNFGFFQKKNKKELELYFNRYVMPKDDFIKEFKHPIMEFANEELLAPKWLSFMAENAQKM